MSKKQEKIAIQICIEIGKSQPILFDLIRDDTGKWSIMQSVWEPETSENTNFLLTPERR
jgi:hypothetical protein